MPQLPGGFAHDFSRTQLGRGQKIFRAAVTAFENWKQFNLGWVRVANSDSRLDVGQLIAVEIRTLGLWSLNISQIVDVVSDAGAFGFIYSTPPEARRAG